MNCTEEEAWECDEEEEISRKGERLKLKRASKAKSKGVKKHLLHVQATKVPYNKIYVNFTMFEHDCRRIHSWSCVFFYLQRLIEHSCSLCYNRRHWKHPIQSSKKDPTPNMELLLSDSDRTQILLGLDCRSLLKLAATSKQWMRIIAPADSQENSNREGENPATAPLHRIIPSWWRRHYQTVNYSSHESHPLPALVSRFATLRIIFNSLTEQASLSAASLLLSSSPLNLQILELWNMDSGAALSLLSSSLLKRSLRYVQILRVPMTPELLEAAVTGFHCPDYCLLIGTSAVASILSASTSPPIGAGAGTADDREVASTSCESAVSAATSSHSDYTNTCLPLSISGTHVQTQANAGALNTSWSNLNSMILINGTVEELVAIPRWFPALLRICITSKLLEQPIALQSVFSSFSHHLVSLSINRITWPDVDPVGENNLPASATGTGSAIASCNFSQSSTGSDAFSPSTMWCLHSAPFPLSDGYH